MWCYTYYCTNLKKTTLELLFQSYQSMDRTGPGHEVFMFCSSFWLTLQPCCNCGGPAHCSKTTHGRVHQKLSALLSLLRHIGRVCVCVCECAGCTPRFRDTHITTLEASVLCKSQETHTNQCAFIQYVVILSLSLCPQFEPMQSCSPRT